MNNSKHGNQPANDEPEDSEIPSGYTYLGQFIAHEITFDNTQELPMVQPDPQNLRSPSIDLDSLYGAGPGDDESKKLYEDADPARLKVGETTETGSFKRTFDNYDLPRDKKTGEGLIGDPRNDENLPVAQTHVALINFHNNVVRDLRSQGYNADDLFDCARRQVVRHFQWVIIHDYLPTILDVEVLDCVLKHGPNWFRANSKDDLFMPLEFSAAAFRIGHSMVRDGYQWNVYHSTDLGAEHPPSLSQLFDQTAFSGIIGKDGANPSLQSEWIIDWRRFFNFPEELGYQTATTGLNKARRIDTNFSFPLHKMERFPHHDLPEEKRSITVRNLLRGFALGLPTGEEMAEWIGETPLCHEDVANGPHSELLSTPIFKGKTPLWYYVLKEAELRGGSRLGPVGSRIIAETLVGLIRHSCYSILAHPEWRPKYGRLDPETGSVRFEMTDLLHTAGVVNPIGG